jgi:hypothetical protein
MEKMLVPHHSLIFDQEDDAPPDVFDAEEQLHELARRHAVEAAREGHLRSGRGAVIVPWPPEERLSVSFLPERACAALGQDVARRVATFDPRSQFVMVYLLADGDTDAYTYRIPDTIRACVSPALN